MEGIGSCYFPSTYNQIQQLLLYFQYNQLYVQKHQISTKNSMSPFANSVSSDGEQFLCQARLQLEKKILLLRRDEAPAVFGNTSKFAILGNKEVHQASLWLIGFYIREYLHQKTWLAIQTNSFSLPWQLSVSSETGVWRTRFTRGVFLNCEMKSTVWSSRLLHQWTLAFSGCVAKRLIRF